MYYYKQEYDGGLLSLQTCSKRVEKLPDGFTEISAEEYADIAEELRKAAEATTTDCEEVNA